ncbi:MAG: endopeptidase La [Lachnospiraceae bacterium]|nr:endopeptidase La [Lachnospiraceae bacterium]
MDNELMTKKIPAVALRGLTILPDMIIHFDLSRQKSIKAVEQAMMVDEKVMLVTQKDPDVEEPGYEDVYHVGTVAVVKQVNKLPNGIVRVLVEGQGRGTLLSFLPESEDFLLAEVQEIPTCEGELDNVTEEAMIRQLAELFGGYSKYYPKVGRSIEKQFQVQKHLEKLIDLITMSMPLSFSSKQKVLELSTVTERFEYLAGVLSNEIEIARVKVELSEKVKGRVEKNQKEYLLREQLNYIRQELGEDGGFSDAEQFEEALSGLKAKKEVKERIRKEISRFKSLAPNSGEASVERGYIETLLEMPWDKMSKDNTDIDRAEQILEDQHYGLEQVKERILEFLAVRSLTRQGDSPIICLVGPPGTGKTSIARSVAEALDKKYVRISLGGVRDEAEIRGHRKTYVGAMPGRIAGALKQAGVKNPLMLLDEIDKVSSDYKGDTSAALLEVLDSEQNSRFRDHYIEIPIDLSEVLFIATANTTSTIPRPLLDRMEIIEVTSYTANEKFHIAKDHLIPKQWKKNGLSKEQLSISDNALRMLIDGYTREAGVRDLERKLGEICRKAAREILKKPDSHIKVTSQTLEKYLGHVKFTADKRNLTDEVGIVRGLAWTSVGGDTLQIEVNVMPGKGDIDLTGQMGDVMKESAIIGMSYVRSISKKYHVKEDVFRKNDFHIHIPEGAVPKDGPSAGVTMATALMSAVTGIPVRADVAMTGEITLRGRVLPIGGLKEKLLAAKIAGMKKVLVPEENRPDVEEISREIKGGMDIVFVGNMTQVLEHALVKVPEGRKE